MIFRAPERNQACLILICGRLDQVAFGDVLKVEKGVIPIGAATHDIPERNLVKPTADQN